MPKISYDSIPNDASGTYNPNGFNFEFFALRNDGDEALVRIMHDTTDSFNMYTTHHVNNGGKNRKVNCIRELHDSIESCPFCSAGIQTSNVILINMVQYFQDPQTQQIISKPVVWERSLSYATRLKNLIDEYGPLSDCLFKIKRSGAAGSRDTTYDIFYCSPKIYRDDIYVKNANIFDGFDPLGGIILNKSVQEMNFYLQTGGFPVSNNSNAQADPIPQAAPAPVPQQYNYYPKQDNSQMTTPHQVNYPTQKGPADDTPPWEHPVTGTPIPEQGYTTPATAPQAPPVTPRYTPESPSPAQNPGRPSSRYY